MKTVIQLTLSLACAAWFTCALAQIPDTQSSQGISYISGGVGQEETKAILVEAKQWPLMLELSQMENGRGVWIFGAKIKITNAKQKTIFDAQADGPYILINLSPGDYQIDANYEGVSQKRTVSIQADQVQKLSMFWK